MSPEYWRKLEDLFQSALDLDPAGRSRLLESADPEVREQVRALLAQDERAHSFIETPAVAHFSVATAGDTLSGEKAGAYRIGHEIGRGGMGTVYAAVRVDGAFHQQVALKVIQRELQTPELLGRFRRERQILAMLNHPNITRILDAGTTADGRPYYVMELVEGETITRYAASRGLKLDERLRLFLAVCEAVAHAHRNLVIHRDLKPANILVTADGGVKLLDFGIARIFQPDPGEAALTVAPAGRLLTPSYAAPEQVRGEPVTTATDVYALGLILYEMLSGRRAQRVESASLAEIERTVCQEPPPRLSAGVAEGGVRPVSRLRGDLETIVLKALEKDPARRYATVNQFAEDIERFRAGRPVSARPDRMLYRAAKFVRRNKLAVGAAVAVVVSLATGIAVAVEQARIAHAHFDSVRSLARSLINEIQPAIDEVPGTTRARHLLVKRSLEYLDRLAANSRDNVPLLTELAEAYETIGNIQGNRNKSNLGDYGGAMASFRKAIALRERIERLAPSPANRQWIALIQAEAARVYPNTGEALRLALSAVLIAEELQRTAPKAIYNFLLPNSLFGLGYIYSNLERAEDAIRSFERAREIFVGIRRSKMAWSVCDRYIAQNHLLLGRPAMAETHYRRAMAIDEDRLRDRPGARGRMDLSYDYEGLAQALEAQGRAVEALAMARKAEAIRRELAAADLHDQRARLAVADVEETLGLILSRLGQRRESLDYSRRALEARDAFVKASPESPEDLADLARARLNAAIAYRRFGLCAQSDALLAQARPVFVAQKRRASLARLESPGACPSPGNKLAPSLGLPENELPY